MEETPGFPLLANTTKQGNAASSINITGTQNRTNDSSKDFIEELESILNLNDKIHIQECCPYPNPVPEPFASSGYELYTIYDILNENSQPVLKLARCVPKHKRMDFIIAHSLGSGLLSINKKSCSLNNQRFEISGEGLLSFEQVVTFWGGYLLQDPCKKHLRIKTGWISYFPFLLYCISATMKLVNLDGRPAGSIVYYKKNTLSIEYVRGMDQKAKYMILASVLLPLSTYFSEPGRTMNTIVLILWFLVSFIVSAPIIYFLLNDYE